VNERILSFRNSRPKLPTSSQRLFSRMCRRTENKYTKISELSSQMSNVGRDTILPWNTFLQNIQATRHRVVGRGATRRMFDKSRVNDTRISASVLLILCWHCIARAFHYSMTTSHWHQKVSSRNGYCWSELLSQTCRLARKGSVKQNIKVLIASTLASLSGVEHGKAGPMRLLQHLCPRFQGFLGCHLPATSVDTLYLAQLKKVSATLSVTCKSVAVLLNDTSVGTRICVEATVMRVTCMCVRLRRRRLWRHLDLRVRVL
jgi:hypothetical protein